MKMYKIKGVQFPKDDEDGTWQVVKGLIDLVNSRANTNLGMIETFALTCYEDTKRFRTYSGDHAAVGYCLDPRINEVYFAFRGKVDLEIARRTLAERYIVEDIDGLPRASSRRVIQPLELVRDIEERRKIEGEGCAKPDEKNHYIPPVNVVKSTTLEIVLKKRVARGEITQEQANAILSEKYKKNMEI